ncbi:MAG: hypothetical protein H0X73_09615 [Chthoniobacterales bacterium]|nr:hypothetical protein [Chthoniobacterales bacterium]
MKSFLAMFQLTVPEQRIIIALLLVFVAVVAAKKYLDLTSEERRPAEIIQLSSSPGTRA